MLASAKHSPLMVRPGNLVSYWPLHGRAGAAGGEENWAGDGALAQAGSPGLADHPRIIYPRRRIWTPKAAAAATVPTLSAATATLITQTTARPRVTITVP